MRHKYPISGFQTHITKMDKGCVKPWGLKGKQWWWCSCCPCCPCRGKCRSPRCRWSPGCRAPAPWRAWELSVDQEFQHYSFSFQPFREFLFCLQFLHWPSYLARIEIMTILPPRCTCWSMDIYDICIWCLKTCEELIENIEVFTLILWPIKLQISSLLITSHTWYDQLTDNTMDSIF